jgi:DNA (cytosine-5)-methyltransferase 1
MITIGTDCSGIEAPIEALRQLGVPFQHKWSCEIDKFARQSILANYEPEILYDDITQRNHSQLPDVDIYVCGFPCQSFSLMGKKKGTNDPRSNIMLHCIDVIKTKRPPVFILENVKNFMFIENGKPYNFLKESLLSITDEDGDQVYTIYSSIYNTKDYGIPQNRERIYIIGIKSEIQHEEFQKPNHIHISPLCNFFIDSTPNTLYKPCKSLLRNILKLKHNQNVQVITPFTFQSTLSNLCPALTTQCSKYYVLQYNRTLLPFECLLLQGFTSNFVQKVTNSQLYKQAGNTMSVNVLKAIFTQIFKSTVLQNMMTAKTWM